MLHLSNLPPDAIPLSYQACQKFGGGTKTFDRGLITSSWGDILVISHIDCGLQELGSISARFFPINPSGRVFGVLSPFGSKWYDGIIGSIPCGCIECITASVPPALIVPFNSDQEIYPFVTSHAV